MKTLVEAIQEKYLSEEDEEESLTHVIIVGSPSSSNGSHTPPILVMDACNIHDFGCRQSLSSMCSHVIELDLSFNQLSDWQRFWQPLAHCMPQLQWLNLSNNPLPNIAANELPDLLNQHNLQTLIVNDLQLNWPLLLKLLQAAPNLLELRACSCGLGDLADENIDNHHFVYLRQFYCNHNCIASVENWQIIAKLFPNLEKLTIIDNAICELPANCNHYYALFHCLSSLNLSDNLLKSWEEIDRINHFPQLTDLRISNLESNMQLAKDKNRAELIARLPNIHQLNGTPVSDAERLDAERAFVRRYMSDSHLPKRYHELEQKHGKLEPLVNIDLTPEQSVDLLVSYNSTKRAIRFATALSIGDLKRQVCDEFKLSCSRVNVFYIDSANPQPCQLNYSRRALHSYRPCDGDQLLIIDKVIQ